MNKTIKIFAWILGSLLIIIAILSLITFVYLKFSVPKDNGEMEIESLSEVVEVYLDEYGIPHFYADNMSDLFTSQGYFHARDRLFQMELYRRSARGTLSEIFGKVTLESDIYMRNIRLYESAKRDFEKLDSMSVSILEDYCDGINSFIFSKEISLPPEFAILRFSPEKWKPVDCLSIGKLLSLLLSYNHNREKMMANILNKYSYEKIMSLLPEIREGEASFIRSSDRTKSLLKTKTGKNRQNFNFMKSYSGIPASNNWVVSGEKTVTGKPILANDPHLPPQIPSIWYENHLCSPEFEITGVSIPGLPLVLIGHNRKIAWGITALVGDNQDLFEIQQDSLDNLSYLIDGKPEKYKIIKETINISGADPHEITFYSTRFGPVLKSEKGPEYALRWSMYDGNNDFSSFLGVNRAGNFSEFREALGSFSAPSLNLVYADIEGNIGYQSAGLIPVRPDGDGMIPRNGSISASDWTGYIPYEKMPAEFNPAENFLVTANNKITAKEYPYLIAKNFLPSCRAERIQKLLSDSGRIRLEDFRNIQKDFYSEPAARIIDLIKNIPAATAEAIKAKEILVSWDAVMNEKGPSLLFQHFFQRLLSNIFSDEFESDVYKEFCKYFLERNGYLITEKLLKDTENTWFNNKNTQKTETVSDIINTSLSEAIIEIEKEHGRNPEKWNWGKEHSINYTHALGRVKILAPLFNPGPVSTGGDNSTVFATAYHYDKPFNTDYYTVSYRQIIDLADWDNSVSVNCLGQSGHPMSPHYKDQLELWRNVRYHSMWFSRDKVEQNCTNRIDLVPWF